MTSTRKWLRVRAYTLKEAIEIMFFLRRKGYEGVQNDSMRYCDEFAMRALKEGHCYICAVTGRVKGSVYGRGSMYVANGHDPKRKLYTEVSKSKFMNEME